MTLTNMAIEAGGKNGICDVDDKTLDYVRNRSNIDQWQVYEDDPGAKFCYESDWDLNTLEPMVAKPHSPDNKDSAHNCREVKIDRAYIGSCTGGKITDMIFAAASSWFGCYNTCLWSCRPNRRYIYRLRCWSDLLLKH